MTIKIGLCNTRNGQPLFGGRDLGDQISRGAVTTRKRQSRGSQFPRLSLLKYFLGWFSNLTIYLRGHTYLCAGSRSHFVSWPLIEHQQSVAWAARLPTTHLKKASSRVRGRGLCTLQVSGAVRHQLLVFETAFVRHLILARDRFLSLSLLLWHIVMLRTAVGPIADSCFANLGWVPIAKPVFGYLQNGLGQEHSSRQVRFI